MTGCVRSAELEAARDGRLAPEAVRALGHHAQGCLQCRAAQAELAALTRLAQALPGAAPDALAARRMRSRLMGAALMGDPAPSSAKGGAWLRVALAAALVLVVGGALALRLRGVPGPAAGRDAAMAVAPRAATPGQRVELGGAGWLWPADDARVYVRSSGRDTRIELWHGAITMQVRRRHAGERFVVQLRDAEVEVRGTRFSVAADAGRLVRVDVTEGLVAVRVAGEAERLLPAGAHLLLASRAPTVVPRVAQAPVPAPEEPEEPAEAPRPVTRPDPGVWFREGSFAYARGDHGDAVRALVRFLSAAGRRDPRREDARYLHILSLQALDRVDALGRASARYCAEFPRGLRRAEVVLVTVQTLAAAGRCAEAREMAARMPDDAPGPTRRALGRVQRCGVHPSMGDAP